MGEDPRPHPLADGGWQRYVDWEAEKQYSSHEMVSGALQKKSVWNRWSLSVGKLRAASAALTRPSQMEKSFYGVSVLFYQQVRDEGRGGGPAPSRVQPQ